MIKILAVADTHIGAMFHGNSMAEEHKEFFKWLIDKVGEKMPDAVLVAGDVFNNGNPTIEAQRIYYDFLTKMHTMHPDVRLVIISGNHDSAARLDAPKDLLEALNICVVGRPRMKGENVDYDSLIVPVMAKSGEMAYIVCVPYLRDGQYIKCGDYGESVANFIDSAVVRAREKAKNGEPVIILTHLYASGARVSNDMVGGADAVDFRDAVEKADLTVMGHIHRRQTAFGRERVRYVGSAVPMSFTEEDYIHGAELYIYKGDGFEVESLEYEPLHKLVTICGENGSLEAGIEELRKLPKENDAMPKMYVRFQYKNYEPTATTKILEAMERKNAILCVCQLLQDEKKGGMMAEKLPQSVSYSDFKNLKPIDMLKELYRNVRKTEMPEEVEKLAMEAVRRVGE